MYLPVEAINLLPELYKTMLNPATRVYKEGIVIKFVSVLFTQGIDIQQTIVNTIGKHFHSLILYVKTFNRVFSYCLFRFVRNIFIGKFNEFGRFSKVYKLSIIKNCQYLLSQRATCAQ